MRKQLRTFGFIFVAALILGACSDGTVAQTSAIEDLETTTSIAPVANILDGDSVEFTAQSDLVLQAIDSFGYDTSEANEQPANVESRLVAQLDNEVPIAGPFVVSLYGDEVEVNSEELSVNRIEPLLDTDLNLIRSADGLKTATFQCNNLTVELDIIEAPDSAIISFAESIYGLAC